MYLFIIIYKDDYVKLYFHLWLIEHDLNCSELFGIVRNCSELFNDNEQFVVCL
jgi:hypothetical protein